MFYSHSLLSKKGSLGTIWVAAHCYKRLKKEDISQTNISSSVDKILLDEVPFVTYRILGFLLLGVVRIYSKKVEYLVRDCRDVLSEVCHFVTSKKSNDDVEVMCAPYSSITVPERFELDAFDLDVIEDSSRDHTKTQEEIALKGKKIRIWSPSFHQSYFEEDATYFRDYSAGKNFESVYTMTTEMLASSSNNLRSLEETAERLRSNRFVLEECLPPMIFDEAEERAYPGRTFHEDNHAKGVEMLKPPSYHVMLGDDVRPADNDECSDSAGATTPVLMAVRTPAAKETARISKKRKCLYDDNMIVIPNEIYKAALDDPSDLVKKRRKTLLRNSAVKVSDKIFFEPLTPCVSINIRSLLHEKEQKNPEKIETKNTPTKSHDVGSLASDEIHGENAVASIKTKDTPTKTQDIGSHTSDKTHREDTIAPSTPVNSSLSLRHTFGTTTTEALGCARSFASVDRVLSPSEDSEFDASLMTQEEEIEFCEGDDKEKYRWSARTRAVASFLRNEFFDRKKRGADEVVKFSQILEGNSKKRSARFFYELLVLKTQGFLNVKQENLYDDISVVGTSKLNQVFEVDDMA